MSNPIYIPLLNPNEPEALLAALHVKEGQAVAKDDPLCTLETTKSTAEVLAENQGYVVGLRFEAGHTVRAGELLCFLAEIPDWTPPKEEQLEDASSEGESLPEGIRITQPALALAHERDLDLHLLPIGPLVTVGMVAALLDKSTATAYRPPASEFDPGAIVIYGGGGHGKSCIDLLRALNTYQIVGVVDDGPPAHETVMGIPLIGGGEALAELYARGVRLAVNAVGGIGNVTIRIEVFQRLADAGFVCPTLAHPTAFIEPSAQLAPGVQIFPHAYIGSEVKVGYGVIVNTGAIVSHDCTLGDYANISPGAILAGGVQLGSGALIGMGATVNLLAHIGAGARIGNGATVKEDVPEKGIVRAGSIWPA